MCVWACVCPWTDCCCCCCDTSGGKDLKSVKKKWCLATGNLLIYMNEKKGKWIFRGTMDFFCELKKKIFSFSPATCCCCCCCWFFSLENVIYSVCVCVCLGKVGVQEKKRMKSKNWGQRQGAFLLFENLKYCMCVCVCVWILLLWIQHE